MIAHMSPFFEGAFVTLCFCYVFGVFKKIDK